MRFEPERLWIEYETAYPEVIAKSDVVDLLKLDHYLKHGDFYFEVSRQGIVIKVFAQGTKRRPKLTITFPTINQSYESIYGALFAQ